MPYLYQHTQIGWLPLVAAALSLVAVSVMAADGSLDFVGMAMLAALAVISLVLLALFPSMTVKVGEGILEVRFGPGVVRKVFPLTDIESCRVVEIFFWDACWGTYYAKGGLRYLNFYGFRVVEIEMRNGKTFRFGTNEPEKAALAIGRYVI